MPEKREIKASHFVRDIRAGMTTTQLMRKYQLSPRECQSLYGQIEQIIPDPGRLYGRLPMDEEDDAVSQAKRLYPRHDIPLPLSVLDIKKMNHKGLVLDIAAKGLKTQGIDARPMNVETLVILTDELFDIGPIVLDAQCRWAKRQGLHGTWVAGFQIEDISKRNLNDLLQLIEKIVVINQRESQSAPGRQEMGSPSTHTGTGIHWVCPACEMPQNREYEECPQCGVIVAKYLSHLDTIKDQLRQSLDAKSYVYKKVSIPTDVWEEIETHHGDASIIVAEALDFYLRSKRIAGTVTGI
ncbi:MAG: PilZ domain-containing protein [Desulfomonilaceae bacterium]|nr:PilZ domain-containing protein [Desulfomonilaceae bacterium]